MYICTVLQNSRILTARGKTREQSIDPAGMVTVLRFNVVHRDIDGVCECEASP